MKPVSHFISRHPLHFCKRFKRCDCKKREKQNTKTRKNIEIGVVGLGIAGKIANLKIGELHTGIKNIIVGIHQRASYPEAQDKVLVKLLEYHLPRNKTIADVAF